MREACGSAKLKTILAVGDLPSYRDIYKSSLVCMMAGADTIKTSTGKETIKYDLLCCHGVFFSLCVSLSLVLTRVCVCVCVCV